MSITLDLTDPAIKAKLAELPEKMLEYAFEVLTQQAELIKALAQIYVPVETGSLRDSIRIERGGIGKAWRQVKVRAGGYVTNPKTGRIVDYAKYQEFGTRYVYGQFYLTRAVEEVQPTIAAMIKEGVVEKVSSNL
jgi:HK97 gp10 family phage protein